MAKTKAATNVNVTENIEGIDHAEMFKRAKRVKALQAAVNILNDLIQADKQVIGDMMIKFKLEEYTAGDLIKCTYKNESRTNIDRKKLEAEHPKIFKQYLVTSVSRVFRIY